MTDFGLIKRLLQLCRAGTPMATAYDIVASSEGVERLRVVDAYCKALMARMRHPKTLDGILVRAAKRASAGSWMR